MPRRQLLISSKGKIKMKHKTIPIFVPHMGCPNDCSFCNQKKITGRQDAITNNDVAQQIETALSTITDADTIEIGFFGGSFTGIDECVQNEFLKTAKHYIDSGRVNALRVSTRPDYINVEILQNLKNYGVTTIELGAQSMDDKVLKLNRRGHNSADTVRASQMIKAFGFNLGLQMMTGLYGDDNETCLESLEKVIALKPNCVRIYPTLVLSGTYLAELYTSGEYKPQTLDEAVSLCADMKEMLDKENIKIIRLGLMASDNINPDADVLAGPYHPSIGELVKSEIYFRKLSRELTADARILVNPKDLSAFLGNKRSNVAKFKKNGIDVIFTPSDEITHDEFKIIRKERQ